MTLAILADIGGTNTRVALADAAQILLASGLDLLGVSAPQSM